MSSNEKINRPVWPKRKRGTTSLGQTEDATFCSLDYSKDRESVRKTTLATLERPEEPKRRPKINRAYYHSPEFKTLQAEGVEARLADPAFCESVKAWDVTVGDGIPNGDNEQYA